MVFSSDRLRMSCPGAECMYKGRAVNITRGARHIYDCAAARTAQPALIVDLERYNAARAAKRAGLGAAGATGAAMGGSVSAAPSEEAERWKVKFAMAMYKHGLAFNLFDSLTWRDVLLDISGGRFASPGNRHEVGGRLLIGAAGTSDGQMSERMAGARTCGVSIDGMTSVTRKGVQYYCLLAVGALPGFFSTGRRPLDGPKPASGADTRATGAIGAALWRGHAQRLG